MIYRAYYMADFDPVAFSLGPLSVKWYGIAYVVGFLVGWRLALWYVKRNPVLSRRQVEDLVVWLVIGVVAGGRLGHALFYNLDLLKHPLDLFKIWEGGMSFHGALAGSALALLLFCRRHGKSFWATADMLALCATPGLFFGRIANFINGELWGRVTDVPWAVIFPKAPSTLMLGPLPRHPSQLYEAVGEGLILFLVLFAVFMALLKRQAKHSPLLSDDLPSSSKAHQRPLLLRSSHGLLAGIFLLGYSLIRLLVEFYREPDAHLGFLWFGMTMGQLLSLPMALLGIWLVVRFFFLSSTPKT